LVIFDKRMEQSLVILVFKYSSTLKFHIPVLQVLPLYPRSHPPSGHVPCLGSHGWLIQWQFREQWFPNVPDPHATKIKGYFMHFVYDMYAYQFILRSSKWRHVWIAWLETLSIEIHWLETLPIDTNWRSNINFVPVICQRTVLGYY